MAQDGTRQRNLGPHTSWLLDGTCNAAAQHTSPDACPASTVAMPPSLQPWLQEQGPAKKSDPKEECLQQRRPHAPCVTNGFRLCVNKNGSFLSSHPNTSLEAELFESNTSSPQFPEPAWPLPRLPQSRHQAAAPQAEDSRPMLSGREVSELPTSSLFLSLNPAGLLAEKWQSYRTGSHYMDSEG